MSKSQSQIKHKKRVMHGKARSPVYICWTNMKRRCKGNAGERSKRYWKDRGITYCDRWEYFLNFLDDMGERPKETSLDRIDNDKGYYPENCRWATNKQQLNNRRPVREWKLNSTNTSGTKGVSWHNANKKWYVRYKGKYIGYFHSFDKAVNARKAKEKDW